ncbi:MAG: recombinase RecA [candidate division WOR-3 bacterium]|nr:recombinase RecA [candidate division WOR-3 bacterium]MCX7756834.1 recombinase RecA [candidate division WOR-3 bacterium]MDW7987517.1 recombinase RecA [candidate division WOR-3 bacterium]
MGEEEKIKALKQAISQIEKQFGKGAIMRLGESAVEVATEVIPTGSIGLDYALGIGGLPRGRVIEIFGPEASGKTTLTLQIIAQVQKLGGTAVFIDAEHALDVRYAQALGVDLDNLFVAQPDSGEQALEIAETLTRSGALDVFVVDSVAALVPRAEIEGEMGDAFVGVQARLMSQALRKLSAVISKSKTCAVFTNQIRQKIGVMFGNPETTPGGLALKFYASIRLDIRRIGQIKHGEEIIGSRTKVKVVKNKLAPPFKEAEFDIIYGKGISRAGELVDLGLQFNVLERSGAWYQFQGEKIGQGRENAIQFLESNPELAQKIEKKLISVLYAKPDETKTQSKQKKSE